ncbi:MAG: hypothetical protein Q8K21_06455 [Hydrogenophaga sp.]|uniref:hypothetical protein n=1 Tax=Hydrogenophaga sp. TaxID=1904254 RepID=UPI002730D9A0|nr:hypothetical protein [Hydrogenophaga sp.]MDP2163848.1 hypothetical protein [Hydrogenophaga sp.]MDP3477314.1 hypothetical protein [Hydrogenophaga sp.]
MNSNAPIQATDAAIEPSAQPVEAVVKAVASSPAQKPPRAPVRTPEKIVAKRAVPAAAKKAVVVQAKPEVAKPEAPKKAEPKAAKLAPTRPLKVKMVRDSFTFPETEHKRLVEMKKRLIALGTEVKKGELVRAGLEMLAALDNPKLLKAVAGIEKLKTGRPKK